MSRLFSAIFICSFLSTSVSLGENHQTFEGFLNPPEGTPDGRIYCCCDFEYADGSPETKCGWSSLGGRYTKCEDIGHQEVTMGGEPYGSFYDCWAPF